MTLHGRRLARVISYEMKCVPRFLALILAASPAFGGEYVVFSSGLKMRADRHEQSGGVIRLFYNGGVTEVPANARIRIRTGRSGASRPPAAGWCVKP